MKKKVTLVSLVLMLVLMGCSEPAEYEEDGQIYPIQDLSVNLSNSVYLTIASNMYTFISLGLTAGTPYYLKIRDDSPVSTTNDIVAQASTTASSLKQLNTFNDQIHISKYTPATSGTYYLRVKGNASGKSEIQFHITTSYAALDDMNWPSGNRSALVLGTDPTDDTTAVDVTSDIVVRFSTNVSINGIVVNTANSTCSTSNHIEMSPNDFTNCIQWASDASADGGSYDRVLLDPSSDLSADTTYKIRVNSAMPNGTGGSLGYDYESFFGFTTN
jgi:hypothetical protein